MKFLYSLIAVSLYWCLDAYQAVLNLDIPFSKALLLQYDNSNPLIKLIIVFVILIFTMLKTGSKQEKKDTSDNNIDNEIDIMHSISDVILAPLTLQQQLNNIVEIMQDTLNIKTAFIASFENDKIVLLNNNDSLKEIGIQEKYMPHQNELKDNTLDKLLSTIYLEKRDLLEDTIKIKRTTYRVIMQMIFNQSKKPMGVTVLLIEIKDEINYKNFLKKVSNQIAFEINLTKKKEEAIETQNQYNAQFALVDAELNIPSNTKLQNVIEQEIKRSQRYNTELTLMIIEIDHIKNLANIFTKQDIIKIKREVLSVIKKNIRETDTLGKWSDSQFAIATPDINFREAKKFARKLNDKLQEQRFTKVGKVTCSYGITSISSKDTIGTFRRRAEYALKSAHDRGGNTIEVKILA